MWLFKKKPAAIPVPLPKVNVGIATIKVLFSDNSSASVLIEGRRCVPAKYTARDWMARCPRHDYRLYNEAGDKMTFKEVRSIEIVKIEEYWI